uniref:Uncharacterized protein n=1 Tax=Zea mays TaxID=4577 RepID=C4J088_MAIZE|nr:unknown [Zea mays]|eukprot:NP_001170712.1 putative leucine-rich repeat receptor-like protein kinase family protein [Zea mays]
MLGWWGLARAAIAAGGGGGAGARAAVGRRGDRAGGPAGAAGHPPGAGGPARVPGRLERHGPRRLLRRLDGDQVRAGQGRGHPAPFQGPCRRALRQGRPARRAPEAQLPRQHHRRPGARRARLPPGAPRRLPPQQPLRRCRASGARRLRAPADARPQRQLSLGEYPFRPGQCHSPL